VSNEQGHGPTFEQMREFLVERYKHDRLYGRSDEYGNLVVNSRLDDLARNNVDLISHYEARRGDQIWFTFRDGRLVETEVKYDRQTRKFNPVDAVAQ
jgi:hypothetical protein